MESFHAALRRRIKVSHPNLFAFLGHLHRQADVSRLSRGMTTRRAKKRKYIINDTISASVRRQRLHQTRISESGEPERGRAQL